MEKKEQEIDESKIAGYEKQLDIAIRTGDEACKERYGNFILAQQLSSSSSESICFIMK
jgi:hypothetical protein